MGKPSISWKSKNGDSIDNIMGNDSQSLKISVDLTLKSIAANQIQAKKLIFVDNVYRIMRDYFDFTPECNIYVHKDENSIKTDFEAVPSKEKYRFADFAAYCDYVEHEFFLEIDHYEIQLPDPVLAESSDFCTTKFIEVKEGEINFNLDALEFDNNQNIDVLTTRILMIMTELNNINDKVTLDINNAQQISEKMCQFYSNNNKLPTKLQKPEKSLNENEKTLLQKVDELFDIATKELSNSFNSKGLLNTIVDSLDYFTENKENIGRDTLKHYERKISKLLKVFGIDAQKHVEILKTATQMTKSFNQILAKTVKIQDSINTLQSNLLIDITKPPVGSVIHYIPLQTIYNSIRDINGELKTVSDVVLSKQGVLIEEVDKEGYNYTIDSPSNLIQKIHEREARIKHENELRMQKKQEDLNRYNNLPAPYKDGIPIHPSDYFRSLTDYFSAWDETGLPLADADGEELTTEMRIELSKKYSVMHLEHNLFTKKSMVNAPPVPEEYEYNEA